MKRPYRIAIAAVAVESLLAAYQFGLLPRLRRWGATADEVSRPLPGDDLIADPLYVTTHATTVPAPPEDVFPWLVQIGQNRGGFYSYDFLENLAGLKVKSADRIHSEWQDLRAGEDYMALDPNQDLKLTIAVLEPPHAFVVRSGAPGEPPQEPGSMLRGEMAWTWGFYLEPAGPEKSRLIIRARADWRRGVGAAFAQTFLLEPAHFIMEEGMLRGIRRRVARAAAALYTQSSSPRPGEARP